MNRATLYSLKTIWLNTTSHSALQQILAKDKWILLSMKLHHGRHHFNSCDFVGKNAGGTTVPNATNQPIWGREIFLDVSPDESIHDKKFPKWQRYRIHNAKHKDFLSEM